MASTSARRAAVLDAAQACFAERGYDATTTASICARAGVSSGTFFHHFPTKAAVLVAMLDAGLERTAAELAVVVGQAAADADAALRSWLDRLVAEAGDPHLPVLVSALGAARAEGRVAELLQTEARLAHDALTAVVAAGQQQGRWRTDRPAEQLATWVGVLADGVLGRSLEDPGFDVASRRPELADVVRRILG